MNNPDYTGRMRYLRWRDLIRIYGTNSPAWRIESEFYVLLGRLVSRA